jgi:pimeloyl-ACP methyl ester carboxylesterase
MMHQMRNIQTNSLFFVLGCAIVVSSVGFGFPLTVSADTHVTSVDALQDGASWTKAGSPYVIDADLSFPQGRTFDIEPGVIVMSGTDADSGGTGSTPKRLSFDGGYVTIRGTHEEPVIFKGLSFISIANATATISHAMFEVVDGLTIKRSFVTFEYPVLKDVKGLRPALSISGSHVSIYRGDFEGNTTALRSIFQGKVSQVMNAGRSDMELGAAVGGIGNALGEIDPEQNQIMIVDSVIAGNSRNALYNETANGIDARDIWWGDGTATSGPPITVDRTAIGNTVYGPADVSGWKVAPPAWLGGEEGRVPECCSNTLFLPGIEASRLYVDSPRFGGIGIDINIGGVGGIFGTSTNQLWEPNRNDDVRKLYMSSGGVSLNPNIYTKDVIDGGFGYKIYDAFISMMDELVAEHKIQKWVPFAYDWRQGVDEVVASSTLVDTFLALASSSPTGKVSIVAHSNGGLVAKMLGRKLEDMGKGDLIDHVVFVAVPQLGTPQAIAGMLHGDSQAMLGGIVLSQSVARTLGLSMPGAYGLLPSDEFFKRMSVGNLNPIVTTGGIGKPVVEVRDENSLGSFLEGISDGRVQPAESDTKSASVLSARLLDNASHIHSLIDTWEFSTSTKVISIAGWGMPTTRAVNYINSIPTKNITSFGDGTVLARVADSYPAGSTIYFDEKSAEKNEGDRTHADILQSKSVRDLIVGVLSTTTPDRSSLPPGMSYALPDTTSDSWLTFGIHSPVDIDVYDTSGGHIGLVPNSNPDSDLMRLDNTIPGAVYDSFGDEKFVTVPSRTSTTYAIRMKGTGSGTFTFTMEQTLNDRVVASTTYSDLPVTTLLVATTSVGSIIDTAPPELHLDVDGDGVNDMSVKPDIVNIPSNVAQSTEPSPGAGTVKYANRRNVVNAAMMAVALPERAELIAKLDLLLNLIQKLYLK